MKEREQVRRRRDEFEEEVSELSRKLRLGLITLVAWQIAMKQAIKRYHTDCALIAEKLATVNWTEVSERVKAQYQWLGGFAQDIADKVGEGWEPTTAIDARARLYGAAGLATFFVVLGRLKKWVRWVTSGDAGVCDDCKTLESLGWMLYEDLPTHPGQGATICNGGCRCSLEYAHRIKEE